MEARVVKQWVRDLVGEAIQYNSPGDPKVMYAFRGMYELLVDSIVDTIIHIKYASLSIAKSGKGEEHEKVAHTWTIPSLVQRGYWHDLIQDMSRTDTRGTIESVQQFLERLQELLRQLLDQMKEHGIPIKELSAEDSDEFIIQLKEVMSDFEKLANTTNVLMESFREVEIVEQVETSVKRHFSVSPPSSPEFPTSDKELSPRKLDYRKKPVRDPSPVREPMIEKKDNVEKDDTDKKINRRRHRLRPRRRRSPSPPAPTTESTEEHDLTTSSLPDNILQSLTPRLSES